MKSLSKYEVTQVNRSIAKETIERLGYDVTPTALNTMVFFIQFFELIIKCGSYFGNIVLSPKR